ncbi:MAG: hypothetical protein M1820_003926 [Bogoriella megaspora]|nr:MAG: hypothetical protein M1820_003926 [Bogoriella megaspora]
MDRRQTLLNTKPRKRPTSHFIDIFEDDSEQRDAPENLQCQSFIHRNNGSKQRVPSQFANLKSSESLSRKPRRSSILAHSQLQSQTFNDELAKMTRTRVEEAKVGNSPEAKKAPRRRTIYIPSDETSIFTIHPGAPSRKPPRAASPTQPCMLSALPEYRERPSASNMQPVPPQPKSSRPSLAAAPRRAPLQASKKPVQAQVTNFDVPGAKTGKENLPPDRRNLFEDVIKIPDEKSKSEPSQVDGTVKDRRGSISAKPKRVSIVSQTIDRDYLKKEKTLENTLAALSVKDRAYVRDHPHVSDRRQTDNRRTSRVLELSGATTQQSNVRTLSKSRPSSLAPNQSTAQNNVRLTTPLYPVLSEELERPELYENQWLQHQEIAISQLINSLLQPPEEESMSNTLTSGLLRKKFLEIYSEPGIALLHKRLQASLLYGALSISKEATNRAAHIKDDFGLRRKFLGLWTDSYNPTTLKAAAEVIFGREAPQLSGSTSSPGRASDKKMLDAFLETFLLRNADAQPSQFGREEGFGSVSWSWRRLVTRSLLLVLLLDKAKSSLSTSENLFKMSSQHKSSESILKSLGSMILPSLGDIVRPLVHLDYQVQHVQYPLQEYTYHVKNLAVDLRDGIILTRLTELLLSPMADLPTQDDGTVNFALPSGDLLNESPSFGTSSDRSWVLSQHLKFPCIGRAQKLHNAQIALSALSSVKNIPEQALLDVKAEDIVDGHREKTIRLLWFLISRWGLGALITPSDIKKEIYRLRDRWLQFHPSKDEAWPSDSDSEKDSSDEPSKHKSLLKLWAIYIGRLHNVPIRNLSTSFSDPRAFHAIITHYSQYLPQNPNTSSSVQTTLKYLGCSPSFTSLLISPSTNNRILTPSTTLPTLAVLASRFLPLSRSHHAASTIQRAYRLYRARKEISKRLVLLRVAHHCAQIVRTKEKVECAAVVLQRAWRKKLGERIERLQGDMRGVQALVRGWMVRKREGGRVRREKERGKVRGRRVGGVGW